MKNRKFRVEKEKGKSRFTRWVHPEMNGYFLACCDCGLVHEMQFRAGARGPTRKDGTYKWRDLSPSRFGVMFRARRSPRYTARLRKKTNRSPAVAPEETT